jgi:hypothetical protein
MYSSTRVGNGAIIATSTAPNEVLPYSTTELTGTVIRDGEGISRRGGVRTEPVLG